MSWMKPHSQNLILRFQSNLLGLVLLIVIAVSGLLVSPKASAWFKSSETSFDAAQHFHLKKSQIETDPGQAQIIQIEARLPKGFRLYTDQIKIQKFSPTDFKWGQLRSFPESEFFDKFSNKTRKGIVESGTIEFQFESPIDLKPGEHEITFSLRQQICSEKVCYVPKSLPFSLKLSVPGRAPNLNKSKLADAQREPNQESEIEAQREPASLFTFNPEKGLLWTLIAVFIAGILTSFTPCIFPMIPITLSILGHNAEKNSRSKNLLRSLAYVVGIATTYAILGVAAALTGSLFGKLLAHPVVIWSLAILFLALALSMWGFFEIQAPAFIRSRFQSGQVRGLSGIFSMGMVAGIVASPCVGPVLISILSFVSTTQSVFLGFLYLFVYALGLGLIFIGIGLFSEAIRLLPRSGRWMDQVKFILGLLMVGAACYYLQFVTEDKTWYLITSILVLVIFAWQLWLGYKQRSKTQIIFSSIILSGAISTAVIAIINPQLLNSPKIYTQVGDSPTTASGLSKEELQKMWRPFSEETIAEVAQNGKPTVIDFYADWCAACHELKEKTFSQPGFIALAEQFNLIIVDATEDTDEIQRILTKYNIQGLPTVLFMNKSGALQNDLTFTQFLEWPEVEKKMLEALNR